MILLEEVEDAHPVQLGDQARVIPVIEHLLQMDALSAPWSVLPMDPAMEPEWKAHLSLAGSFFLSACKTRTSILLASRYFCTARMTLMATLARVSRCLASTTLPNVPWPSSRTILSTRRQQSGQTGDAARGVLHLPPIISSGLMM